MTRDETLAQFAPEFLKSRQRERRLVVGLGVLAVVALCGATVALVSSIKTETRVTKIEKSACAKSATDPNKECEELRQAIARNEGIEGPCILHQRVTGEQGKNCPELYVPVNGVSVPQNPPGGDASQPGPTGHQQPGPPSSGPSETPGVSSPPSPPSPPPASGELPEPASPKAEPPGLLDPALGTVCSTADHLIHLC